MIAFDREGNFLRSWGEGQFPRARPSCRFARRYLGGRFSYAEYPRLFPGQTIPWPMRSLQKLEKIE